MSGFIYFQQVQINHFILEPFKCAWSKDILHVLRICDVRGGGGGGGWGGEAFTTL